MKTMLDILDLNPVKRTKGEYGVEIEVEGRRLPIDLDPSIWRIERDGSLRGSEAWEYVMPVPLSLKGVRKSLDYLKLNYKHNNSRIDDSIRAGVHVHMNVQSWTIKQLCSFVMCYYLLEDILVDWCGPNRSGNLFCLRTKDAESVMFALVKAIETRNLRHISGDNIRYSSLNFCSLFKYGSLEFRSMRGTGDLDLIHEWVVILDDLKKGALSFTDPLEVITSMSGQGEMQFLQRALPTTYNKFSHIKDIDKIIRKAARRVQIFAYHINWASIARPNTNPFAQEAF